MNVRPFLRGLAYVANDALTGLWPAPAVARAVDAFAWPEALTEVEAEVDVLEPGELNHRFYCNKCGGGYYTGQHNCLRDSPTAPPAVGDDPEGLEPPPARPSGSPRESSGIDYDRLAGGPW